MLPLLASLYLGIAAFVTLLARVVEDPYGHQTNRRNWLDALGVGLAWLPLLLWTLALLALDTVRSRKR